MAVAHGPPPSSPLPPAEADFAARLMTAAAELCRQDQRAEEQAHGGLLMPCRNVSPLQPPLALHEYEMMERDRGKYLLYYAAIKGSLQRLAERWVAGVGGESPPTAKRPAAPQTIRIVVVGPGGGRLVR